MANRRKCFWSMLPNTRNLEAVRTEHGRIALGGITFHTEITISKKIAIVKSILACQRQTGM